MDPSETLRLLRLTIKQMRVDEDPAIKLAHAEEIAEYFEALDEWLLKEGFLPGDWDFDSRRSLLSFPLLNELIAQWTAHQEWRSPDYQEGLEHAAHQLRKEMNR